MTKFQGPEPTKPEEPATPEPALQPNQTPGQDEVPEPGQDSPESGEGGRK